MTSAEARFSGRVRRIIRLYEWGCTVNLVRARIALSCVALMAVYLVGLLSDIAMRATILSWIGAIMLDSALFGVRLIYQSMIIRAFRESV